MFISYHAVCNYFYMKFENENWECVKETTTLTKEQTTAEDHQWVFNAARNSRTQMHASAGPKQKCVLVQ